MTAPLVGQDRMAEGGGTSFPAFILSTTIYFSFPAKLNYGIEDSVLAITRSQGKNMTTPHPGNALNSGQRQTNLCNIHEICFTMC